MTARDLKYAKLEAHGAYPGLWKTDLMGGPWCVWRQCGSWPSRAAGRPPPSVQGAAAAGGASHLACTCGQALKAAHALPLTALPCAAPTSPSVAFRSSAPAACLTTCAAAPCAEI